MTKPRQQIPKATVTRLAFYLRELQQMQRSGFANIQSRAIAERLGLNDSQVRRDISCLGTVGQRGVGYRVEDLIHSIQSILGTDRTWNVILVGVGNLGRALSGYRGFQEQGFDLLGAFDTDADKIGKPLGQLQIQSLDQLEAFAKLHPIDLAILAVPAVAAQGVVLAIEAAGIPGILNFAPIAVQPSVQSKTIIQEVDLAIELQRLAFSVVR
ncbi:MAG: redox-sensing transcriptional repressor Rex [Planctomycetota bacterium]|nr:redox-sensing transcriptional repressor Rex [Planctomycetota bacterium]